jgi:adenylate kinase
MEHTPVSTVLLIGRPGSGKGTQAELLTKKLGWEILSSGAIFRELRTKEGPLGDKVRSVYDEGILFPYWFPNYLFQNAVLNDDAHKGLIAEGFCRSRREAEVFDEVLTWLGRRYVVFNLAVSDEEAIHRQSHRNKTDARADSDTHEKIQIRLNEYRDITEPVINFFKEKGNLVEIDGEQSPDEIAAELYAKLKQHV